MRERKLALDLTRIVGALALAGLLLAAPAAAQDDDEEEGGGDYYSRPGVYLLAQFSNNVLVQSSGSVTGTRTHSGYSTGAAGALGYRINEYAAVEAAGDWVSGWDATVAGQGTHLVGGTYGINGKGYLMGGRFQPYGLLGLGATFMEARDTQVGPLSTAQWDMGVRLALGLDWYVTEKLGLNFAPSVVIPVGINDSVGPQRTYVSVNFGAFLRFGGD